MTQIVLIVLHNTLHYLRLSLSLVLFVCFISFVAFICIYCICMLCRHVCFVANNMVADECDHVVLDKAALWMDTLCKQQKCDESALCGQQIDVAKEIKFRSCYMMFVYHYNINRNPEYHVRRRFDCKKRKRYDEVRTSTWQQWRKKRSTSWLRSFNWNRTWTEIFVKLCLLIVYIIGTYTSFTPTKHV